MSGYEIGLIVEAAVFVCLLIAIFLAAFVKKGTKDEHISVDDGNVAPESVKPEEISEPEREQEVAIAALPVEEEAEPAEEQEVAIAALPVEEEAEPAEEQEVAIAALPVEEEDDDIEPEEEEESAVSFDDETPEESEGDDGYGHKVLYRFNFSFEAKLIQSPAEQQARYGRILDEVHSYPKLKTAKSWRRERIFVGRKRVAELLFKGRKLCMAFALDPKQFENTKYRVIDASEVKRFAHTPTLMKLTSNRKVKYAFELLRMAAGQYGLKRSAEAAPNAEVFSLPYKNTEELIAEKLVKIVTVGGRGGDNADYELADISALIRERVTKKEAHVLLSDETARRILEDMSAAQEEAPVSSEVAEETPEQADVAVAPAKKKKRSHVNIDELSECFEANARVTLADMIAANLVPSRTTFVKVLARGVLTKPLAVEAQDFSLDAVKMILLVGGSVKKVP